MDGYVLPMPLGQRLAQTRSQGILGRESQQGQGYGDHPIGGLFLGRLKLRNVEGCRRGVAETREGEGGSMVMMYSSC